MMSLNRTMKRSTRRRPPGNQKQFIKPAAQQPRPRGAGEEGASRGREPEGGLGTGDSARGLALTSAGSRGVADEPGVEPHAVGGAEPDVLVGEAEARGRDGVRARQAREHGHVDEALLQRHQRRQADHRHAPRSVRQRLQPPRHLSPTSPAAAARRGVAGASPLFWWWWLVSATARPREACLPSFWAVAPGSGLGLAAASWRRPVGPTSHRQIVLTDLYEAITSNGLSKCSILALCLVLY